MRNALTFVGDHWVAWLVVFATTWLILCCSDLKIWKRFSASHRMPRMILIPTMVVAVLTIYLMITAGVVNAVN